MLVTVTVAPGTTPPEASRTVPEMPPRVICAELVVGSMAATINVATRHRTTRDKRGMSDSLLDVKNVQSTTNTSVVMAIG